MFFMLHIKYKMLIFTKEIYTNNKILHYEHRLK